MQCAHEGCICEAKVNNRYCGDYCREMQEGQDGSDAEVEPMSKDCACGHPGCEAVA